MSRTGWARTIRSPAPPLELLREPSMVVAMNSEDRTMVEVQWRHARCRQPPRGHRPGPADGLGADVATAIPIGGAAR